MWRRAIDAIGRRVTRRRQEWYRQPEVWLILAAVVVPFGWVPALCRFAWTYAAGRRNRRRDSSESTTPTRTRSEADHTPE